MLLFWSGVIPHPFFIIIIIIIIIIIVSVHVVDLMEGR